MRLLSRPRAELDQGMFALMVDGSADNVRHRLEEGSLDLREETLPWGEGGSTDQAFELRPLLDGAPRSGCIVRPTGV